jgi:hypothetical protein
MQVQVKDPGLFAHVAVVGAAQLWVPRVHSFKSAQATPEPVYPRLQAHVRDAGILVQAAEE